MKPEAERFVEEYLVDSTASKPPFGPGLALKYLGSGPPAVPFQLRKAIFFRSES